MIKQQIGSGPEDFSLAYAYPYVDGVQAAWGDTVDVLPTGTHKMGIDYKVNNADPRSLGDPFGVWRSCVTIYNMTDDIPLVSGTSQDSGGSGGGFMTLNIGPITKLTTLRIKIWANQNDGATPPSTSYWKTGTGIIGTWAEVATREISLAVGEWVIDNAEISRAYFTINISQAGWVTDNAEINRAYFTIEISQAGWVIDNAEISRTDFTIKISQAGWVIDNAEIYRRTFAITVLGPHDGGGGGVGVTIPLIIGAAAIVTIIAISRKRKPNKERR